MTEQRINPLDRDFGAGALLRFAFPTIFMMVFMGMYTIVDTVFISRLVGTEALSAVNIVCPVIYATVGLATMLATGGGAIIGRRMGEGDDRGARSAFSLLALCCVALSALIALLGLSFLDPLVRALGASEILAPYCRDYLGVLLLCTPFNMLQVLFQNLLVTAGRPGLGFGLTLAAGCTNAVLDFVFMGPLKMGIMGAAIATGLGYSIPAVAGLLVFMKKRGSLYFCRPTWEGRVLAEACLNGSSEMVSQLATALTTFLFNIQMIKLAGEAGVAAVTVMLYTQFLMSTLYIGFSMGVAPIISFNYGSGNTRRQKRVFGTCLRFIGLSSLAIFALTMIGAPVLSAIFAAPGSTVYQLSRAGFRLFGYSFLASGINIFTSAMFTALSNGKLSAGLSFTRTFGFTTIGLLLLPRLWGVDGLWLAVPIAEGLTVIAALVLLWRGRKRYGYL
ncbi:MATE family efflux transporter [Neobittarella massiliensis]|uniref:Multidrug export protein MepA n=1 Tax=Neobittarella massiliensis (ex Bilen et al. 2018) TaxID=2041842 RepID=A0A8J6IKI5_9FIRM|nr:MATE family efflux transporter [Neobittarella massiliensis]MBC3516281.1 MATE family efflux transporter [Neobittarella massiliensis]